MMLRRGEAPSPRLPPKSPRTPPFPCPIPYSAPCACPMRGIRKAWTTCTPFRCAAAEFHCLTLSHTLAGA
eukprot:1158420-Pelagomonas_calceolata.AAC.7